MKEKISAAAKLLLPALRQYQHNDGSGLLAGYDTEVAERIVAALMVSPAPSAEVETVEVVGYRYTSGHRLGGKWHYQATFPKWDDRKVRDIGQMDELMTIAQHQRIVVAKDAELRKLRDSMTFRTSLIGRLEAELEQLRAQPARQVGGDERESKLMEVAFVLQDLRRFLDNTQQKRKPARDHDLNGDYVAANITSVAKTSEWLLPQVDKARLAIDDLIELDRAALAPAAVVIPKTELWQCQNTENRNLVYLPYKPQGPWDCVEYVRRDEVARLNRRAIPVGLLDKLAHCTDPDCCIAHARGELRAQLAEKDKRIRQEQAYVSELAEEHTQLEARLTQLAAQQAAVPEWASKLLHEASKLGRDIWTTGLQAGGEQYPNAHCCIDLAQRIDKAMRNAPAAPQQGVVMPDEAAEWTVRELDRLLAGQQHGEPEFLKGDTDAVGDEGKFQAGIHHRSPEGGSNGVWYQRIVCFGECRGQAETLRDRILARLNADRSTQGGE